MHTKNTYPGEPPLSGITLNLLAPQLTHIAIIFLISVTLAATIAPFVIHVFLNKSGRSFLAGLVGACPKKIASMVLKLDRKV